MKKDVLITVSYLTQIEEEEISRDFGALDKVQNEISKDLNVDVGENVNLEWKYSSAKVLDPDSMNCGKCSKCNGWVTDKDKESPIEGLCNGAILNGQLLCDECLPPDHRWAF